MNSLRIFTELGNKSRKWEQEVVESNYKDGYVNAEEITDNPEVRADPRILSADETPISNEYSMVKVHFGVTFRKTKDKLIEFDVTYFVQKIGTEPKIIMFIAHQDEQKAMQELGLISE
jgi:hypothetical protein